MTVQICVPISVVSGVVHVNLATNSSSGSSFSAMKKVKFRIVRLKFPKH